MRPRGARLRLAPLATAVSLLAALPLAGCEGPSGAGPAKQRSKTRLFPEADRPVAQIVSSRWSTEEERDKAREADLVMDKAGVTPGMTVADLGAGEGYYTVRLAARVGPEGRVLAQDIFAGVRDALAARVNRERLDNVSVVLGLPDDPKLPAASFDRVFMVHMYHEIAQPYALLWNLRPSLKPGGQVIVIDADRPTQNHGTPPALLRCEFAAVGYVQVKFEPMPNAGGYFAAFEPRGPRPEPRDIRACRLD